MKKFNEVIEKAKEVFRAAKKTSILTGEGLTRKELRLLERKKMVKKTPTYRKKKYINNPSTIIYAWEWVGE